MSFIIIRQVYEIKFMSTRGLERALYQRLKYGLLLRDRELKQRIVSKLNSSSELPLFQKILELLDFLESLRLPRVSEKDLPLLAACLPVIYELTGLVPLDFEEVFLAVRYFLADKVRYKKDKLLVTLELLRLKQQELLESVPMELRNIVKYLAAHQGEVEDRKFIADLGLSTKEFYRLVQELEDARIAKWTLGFKVKLDIYGKLLAKLLETSNI